MTVARWEGTSGLNGLVPLPEVRLWVAESDGAHASSEGGVSGIAQEMPAATGGASKKPPRAAEEIDGKHE